MGNKDYDVNRGNKSLGVSFASHFIGSHDQGVTRKMKIF